jgi:hypothetical protein
MSEPYQNCARLQCTALSNAPASGLFGTPSASRYLRPGEHHGFRLRTKAAARLGTNVHILCVISVTALKQWNTNASPELA